MSQPRQVSGPGRAWVQRTDLMAKALLSMKRNCAIAVLAKILYNAPDELIAEKLHMTPAEAYELGGRGLSQLRHPARSMELTDVSFEAIEGALVIDRTLRLLLESWRLEEMFGTSCAQCAQALEVPFVDHWGFFGIPGRPGRPRSYCSNACRQKAYRIRQRTARDGHAGAEK